MKLYFRVLAYYSLCNKNNIHHVAHTYIFTKDVYVTDFCSVT